MKKLNSSYYTYLNNLYNFDQYLGSKHTITLKNCFKQKLYKHFKK